MQFVAHTDNKPIVLMFRVLVKRPCKIRLSVCDNLKPNTVYQDRYKTIQKEGVFYVRMPQSPKHALVRIFNMAVGNTKDDGSFMIAERQFLPLKSKFTLADIKDRDVRDFVVFAQQFCENASILSAGEKGKCSIYTDDASKYRINYFDVIRKRDDGKPLMTPARISKSTGIIDVAKSRFVEYSVPMRLAILLHEYSHYYVNGKMEDEEEADYNALLIYLGLGYPRIEAEKVFLKVFYKTPSDGNMKRFEKIHDVITNFEKVGMKLNEKYYYEGE